MRFIAAVLVVASCRPAPPRKAAPPQSACRRDHYAGDACQEETIQQSLCLVQPDDKECGPLRTMGLLPPPPPPPSKLARCYLPERVLGPGTWTRLCLTLDMLSLLMGGEWDQIHVVRWRREDEPKQAIWVVELEDGRHLWLAPRDRVVDVANDDGWSMTMRPIDFGDDSYQQISELPALEDVCKAAHACEDAARGILAARLPKRPPSDAEIEIEPIDLPSGGVTLRACRSQRQQITALLQGREVAKIPRVCTAPLIRGRPIDGT